jgi:hypothetical protein
MRQRFVQNQRKVLMLGLILLMGGKPKFEDVARMSYILGKENVDGFKCIRARPHRRKAEG